MANCPKFHRTYFICLLLLLLLVFHFYVLTAKDPHCVCNKLKTTLSKLFSNFCFCPLLVKKDGEVLKKTKKKQKPGNLSKHQTVTTPVPTCNSSWQLLKLLLLRCRVLVAFVLPQTIIQTILTSKQPLL